MTLSFVLALRWRVPPPFSPPRPGLSVDLPFEVLPLLFLPHQPPPPLPRAYVSKIFLDPRVFYDSGNPRVIAMSPHLPTAVVPFILEANKVQAFVTPAQGNDIFFGPSSFSPPGPCLRSVFFPSFRCVGWGVPPKEPDSDPRPIQLTWNTLINPSVLLPSPPPSLAFLETGPGPCFPCRTTAFGTLRSKSNFFGPNAKTQPDRPVIFLLIFQSPLFFFIFYLVFPPLPLSFYRKLPRTAQVNLVGLPFELFLFFFLAC